MNTIYKGASSTIRIIPRKDKRCQVFFLEEVKVFSWSAAEDLVIGGCAVYCIYVV